MKSMIVMGIRCFYLPLVEIKESRAINSQLARGKAVARLVYALSPNERADLYVFIEVFFVN